MIFLWPRFYTGGLKFFMQFITWIGTYTLLTMWGTFWTQSWRTIRKMKAHLRAWEKSMHVSQQNYELKYFDIITFIIIKIRKLPWSFKSNLLHFTKIFSECLKLTNNSVPWLEKVEHVWSVSNLDSNSPLWVHIRQ